MVTPTRQEYNKRYFRIYRATRSGQEAIARAKWKHRGLPGMTLEAYEKLLAAQHGKCAITGCSWKCTRNLAVDHDHETGKIRGLLCTRHNTLLGHMERGEVKKLEQYLERASD